MLKYSPGFFSDENPQVIARRLLGDLFCTCIEGRLTTGIIVETEAYQGPEDRGSHAFSGRRTARTEVMFGKPGLSYVYICYGIHNLYNVVTGPEGRPHAVLLRALEPVSGIDIMQERRGPLASNFQITAGPGALCQALGITRQHNAVPVDSNLIWIEKGENKPGDDEVIESPRVGMNFEGFWHSVPWRFRIKGSPWTSRAR